VKYLYEKIERVLLEAVRTGGEYIRKHTGEHVNVQFKTSWSDLVTAVDKAVERQIRSIVHSHFPDHGFVGEEGGGGWDREYTWVLDPVDGTNNFVHTLPNYVCSLACYKGTQPLVAAVFDPNRDEMFTARRGGGAYLNGVRIHVDQAAHLHESLICTNLMWDMREDRFRRLPGLQELGRNVRGIRSLGAAALEICYVACGRVSAFIQYQLSPWDYGAAALMVAEAGGRITQMDGSPLDIRCKSSILATNGILHDELVQLLRERPVPDAQE